MFSSWNRYLIPRIAAYTAAEHSEREDESASSIQRLETWGLQVDREGEGIIVIIIYILCQVSLILPTLDAITSLPVHWQGFCLCVLFICGAEIGNRTR